MSIQTIDQLIDALANRSQRIRFEKPGTLTGQTSGGPTSLWRMAGVPGIGSLPTSPVVVTSADPGAVTFSNGSSGRQTYLGHLRMCCAAQADFEVHDRLAHCGGLSGAVATLQAISGFDLSALSGLATRIGDADYSDVQWYLEWFAATGSTGASASVGVTYNDNTTDTIALGSIGTSVGAGRLIPIRSNTGGKFIKAVTGLTLSASTGTAGNIGVSATRVRAPANVLLANRTETYDWAQLGLPEIVADSALFLIGYPTSTSLSPVRGGGKIAEG